jgi:hypothetical protein
LLHDNNNKTGQGEDINKEKSYTHPQLATESLDSKYEKLIAFLNSFGYYPTSRQEAKKLAKELLDQGDED